jgi:hypothetical protein
VETFMSRGFELFDGSGRENFASALLLLCIEEDEGFRAAFTERICKLAGLPPGSALTAAEREGELTTAKGARRRSDLWLRLEASLVLVEVKTHGGWDPRYVAGQVHEQECSTMRKEAVRAVVLLAPRSLLRELPGAIKGLAWDDVFAMCNGIAEPSRILKLAQAHWRHTVKRDFGLLTTESAGSAIYRAATEAACLVTFLRTVLERLGGESKPTDSVWFSSPDGEPGTRGGWSWFGVAVRGEIADVGRVYVGIYTYVDAPKGHEHEKQSKLELYRLENHDEPLASMIFTPVDLTHASLVLALEEFIEAVRRSGALPVRPQESR